jgi:hypothetical protein
MKISDQRSLRLKRQLYYLALGGFILAMIWIGFEIFWAYERTEKIVVEEVNLNPIDTELYTELAINFNSRRNFSDRELDNYLRTLGSEQVLEPTTRTTTEETSRSATIILPPELLPQATDSAEENN